MVAMKAAKLARSFKKNSLPVLSHSEGIEELDGEVVLTDTVICVP
jgi:hypothetical protein